MDCSAMRTLSRSTVHIAFDSDDDEAPINIVGSPSALRDGLGHVVPKPSSASPRPPRRSRPLSCTQRMPLQVKTPDADSSVEFIREERQRPNSAGGNNRVRASSQPLSAVAASMQVSLSASRLAPINITPATPSNASLTCTSGLEQLAETASSADLSRMSLFPLIPSIESTATESSSPRRHAPTVWSSQEMSTSSLTSPRDSAYASASSFESQSELQHLQNTSFVRLNKSLEKAAVWPQPPSQPRAQSARAAIGRRTLSMPDSLGSVSGLSEQCPSAPKLSRRMLGQSAMESTPLSSSFTKVGLRRRWSAETMPSDLVYTPRSRISVGTNFSTQWNRSTEIVAEADEWTETFQLDDSLTTHEGADKSTSDCESPQGKRSMQRKSLSPMSAVAARVQRLSRDNSAAEICE